MSNERRSLYRILHVQPEAPAEIIAAAYRCLMTKLRHHPDLGGEHESAVRINSAYAVLSDPAGRKAYDLARRQKRLGADTRPAARETERSCPFCGSGIPRVIANDTRCQSCASPLAPIAHSLHLRQEAGGRRSGTRVSKDEAGQIYAAPRRKPAAVRLRDLSPTGISLFTAAVIDVGANVRVVAPSFDLVAHVVQVRSRDRIQLVHARLLTARFDSRPGVFISVAV